MSSKSYKYSQSAGNTGSRTHVKIARRERQESMHKGPVVHAKVSAFIL